MADTQNKLNFKWGEHSALPSTSDVGTLYFTKDEGGLYLGVDATAKPRRIQGIVQYYADLTEFQTNVLPPYSEDIIYYIASENALVKWNGETIGADGTIESGKFTILNVTASEFTSKVTELAGDITTNDLAIKANASDITALETALGTKEDDESAAFVWLRALQTSVEALEELTGAGSGSSGQTLSSRITALETWQTTAKEEISTNKSDITSLKSTTASHTTSIGALEGDISNIESDISDINDAASALTTRVGTTETKIGTLETWKTEASSDIATLKSDVQAVALQASTNKTDIADLVTRMNAVDGAKGTVAQLDERVTANEGDIQTLSNDLGDLEARVETNEDNIEKLQTDVTEAKNTANTVSGLVGKATDGTTQSTAFGRIAKLEAADTTINSEITSIKETNTTQGTAITNLQTSVGNLESSVTAHGTDIANLQTAVGKKADSITVSALANRVTAVEDVNTEQTSSISANTNSIDAINQKLGTFEGTVASQLEGLSGDIAGVVSKADKNAENITAVTKTANANAEAITDIQGDISDLVAADSAQDTKITGLESSLNTTNATANQNATDIAGLKGRMTTVEGKFANYSTTEQMEAADEQVKNDLLAQIDSEINAANSLKYIGGISKDSEWDAVTAASAHIGDTYVVSQSNIVLDINGESIYCYAGDLLIATAKDTTIGVDGEVDGVLAVDNTTWLHVKAGYQQNLESTLDVDGNVIRLTSYPGKMANNYGDMGKVTIASANSNLTISTTSNTVTVDMVWGTF